MTGGPTKWQEMVTPIIRRLRLAAMFRSDVTFNAEGAEAMASALEEIAKQLDKVNQVIAQDWANV